jgi:hypothetical protein
MKFAWMMALAALALAVGLMTALSPPAAAQGQAETVTIRVEGMT